MKDQYAGDISDFFKFAFLRAVVPNGARFGVVWYYVDKHDGSADGRHREFLCQKHWRDLDPVLFDSLSTMKCRSVETLETLPIWHAATRFFREPMPYWRSRDEWAAKACESVADQEFVFADPDNGVNTDGKRKQKHARDTEITALAANGRPLAFIKFPHMNFSHDQQLGELHQHFERFSPITAKTCVMVPNKAGGKTPRIRWFTVLNANDEIRDGVTAFVEKLDSFADAYAQVSGL